jgi:hypothetical protein
MHEYAKSQRQVSLELYHQDTVAALWSLIVYHPGSGAHLGLVRSPVHAFYVPDHTRYAKTMLLNLEIHHNHSTKLLPYNCLRQYTATDLEALPCPAPQLQYPFPCFLRLEPYMPPANPKPLL